jgi:two-component system, chemotaxis family, CheB/CheR fusion protein
MTPKPRRRAPRKAIRAKRPRSVPETNMPAPPPRADPTPTERTPIAGIGASAGGLDALTQIFRRLPENPGLPIVVVQHLSPHHKSLLSEILQDVTRMPVEQVSAETRLVPNRVYVIPPDRYLELEDGQLKLTPHPGVGSPHAIDAFFRSLARAAGSGAVGVVLSGTGSDGAIGVREIHAAGGITIVQDPESAEHGGMPRAAIATGVVDLVLPLDAIAHQLVEIAKHPREAVAVGPVDNVPHDPTEQMRRLFALLRKVTGVDFTHYKKATVQRRLQRRMLLCKLTRLEAYLELLGRDPSEVRELQKDLLIQVTSFFREPSSFALLTERVLPELARRRIDGPIRVWVPGCATGEEAYSIAIAMVESLGAEAPATPVQIFATDVSEIAIEHARAGMYPDNIAGDLTPARLRRFFTRVDGSFRVSQAVREMCVFARQDVTRDPPFSRVDLIVCRNLLIYLEAPLQKKLMNVFHYALKAGGFLLLGQAETVGPSTDLFSIADKTGKLYVKKSVERPHGLGFGTGAALSTQPERGLAPPPQVTESQLVRDARQMILSCYGPPGVIIDAESQIVETLGQTGAFLELAPGSASLNLLKMARAGLGHALRMAVHTAKRDGRAVRREGVRLEQEGVPTRTVNVSVSPLTDGRSAPYFLVVFEEETEHDKAPKQSRPGRSARPKRGPRHENRIVALEQELDSTRQHMQSMIQDLEAANEELQSANEEILSSNEELQSTNEELNTAREELQSTNEEINTVNEELHSRNQELVRVNSDLTNLLASVHAAIVIVGGDLCIRRVTPLAERALNLIQSDVGRPIHHIKPNIDCPDLEEHIRAVIDRVTPYRGELHDAQGRWMVLGIRPYKDLENRIDGAVLTLTDIDEQKKAELALRDEQRLLELICEGLGEWVVVLDAGLRVRRANDAFRSAFRLDGEAAAGRALGEIDAAWRTPEVGGLLERALNEPRGETSASEIAVGGRRLALRARRVDNNAASPMLVLVAHPPGSEERR